MQYVLEAVMAVGVVGGRRASGGPEGDEGEPGAPGGAAGRGVGEEVLRRRLHRLPRPRGVRAGALARRHRGVHRSEPAVRRADDEFLALRRWAKEYASDEVVAQCLPDRDRQPVRGLVQGSGL